MKKMAMMFPPRRIILLAFMSICLAGSATGTGVSKSSGPPSFFLQDPNDGLCLGGEDFKRCAIDTLWYVSGKPGNYQLHHRKVDEMDDELCLDKVNCALPETTTRLGSCSHCGAKSWNILGDQESGYVLSEDKGKNCMTRDGVKTVVHKCSIGFTSLTLQFATVDDIKTMESPGARLVTAASDGDMTLVKELLDEGIDVNSRDWDKLTAIIAASSRGHLTLVKFLLSQGADVNAADKDSITALMEASILGDVTLAKFLVDAGAEVDSPAASGVTALWLACGEGRADLAKYLIQEGADVSIERMDGITSLMAGSIGGHYDIVKLLLDSGSNIDAADQDGLTAVMNAAENGSIPVVSLLLDNGASANNMSTTGFTPLIIASAGGNEGVVSLLLNKGAEVDAMHPEGVNALMYASAGGHVGTVKLLIDAGANVNLLHTNGGSALMEAATAGNISVVQTLLDSGADAFVVDNDLITPLMSAASQGHLEACQLLVKVGVSVNAAASSGGTAIMFASGAGHFEVVKYLISAGADVNMKVVATDDYMDKVAEAIAEGSEDVEPHKDGVTSLHVAALGGHLETVQLLLDAGADPRMKDDEDATALLNAVSKNFGDVAFALVEGGADPNDVYIDEEQKSHNLLWDSVVVDNIKFGALLVSKGADLSFRDEHNVTVLIQAAHKGQTTIVAALVERKDDINASAINDEGITALVAAASEGHDEVVKLILDKTNADVNAQDNDGTTALMAAAVRGHKEVIEVLLAHKADVNIQNVDGHTALMFGFNGRNQVASLLDKYSEFITEDKDNSTAVIRKALETHSAIVELLVSHGADVTLKDKKGNLAVDFDHMPKATEGEVNSATDNVNHAKTVNSEL